MVNFEQQYCLFHVIQAVWRNIQRFNVSFLYLNNNLVKNFIRNCLNLSFWAVRMWFLVFKKWLKFPKSLTATIDLKNFSIISKIILFVLILSEVC